MKLTTQQLAFMETFGFLHIPALLEDRIEKVTEEFELVFSRLGGSHAGGSHDITARSCIVPFVDQSEYLSTLLDDPRLDGIISSLCGNDYNYLGSDGNFYVGTTKWHSDGGWAPMWQRVRALEGQSQSIAYYKVALYLDTLTEDTGAIRVIPGSHRYGDRFAEAIEKGIRNSEQEWGVVDSRVPALAVETRPGDVVVFPEGTKHGSWGGSTRRRMFTLNYSSRHSAEQLPLLRQEVAGAARFWNETFYGDAMLRTAGADRMRHLEQVLANRDHLPELVRKARAEANEPSSG